MDRDDDDNMDIWRMFIVGIVAIILVLLMVWLLGNIL